MRSSELNCLIEEIIRTHVGEGRSLDWISGGFRNLTLTVLKHLNLPTPKEHKIYALYVRIDADVDWHFDVEPIMASLGAKEIFRSEHSPETWCNVAP